MSTTPKPSGKINYSRTSKPDFNRAAKGITAKAQRRESFMVKRGKPQPVLRPAPHIANGPDRAAFNQAWRQEYKQAAPPKTPTKPQRLTQQSRKAEFMARRKAYAQSNTKTHKR